MSKLPDNVSKAWDDREGAITFTTVDGYGKPNSIYATCVRKISNDKIVIADNYFNKTRANILTGSNGSILFITKEGTAFQIKGSIDYEKDGEIYDDMKKWLDPKYPGNAAAVLNVEEIYCGADKLL